MDMCEMQKIMQRVHALMRDEQARTERKLPSDAYFLSEDDIVCFPRRRGDSRYPYSADGMTLWAYSSGNVRIEESAFCILPGWENTHEPNLAFFFGEERGDVFCPVSVTGAARQTDEGTVVRYTVFTPAAAYYIAEGEKLDGCVKLYVDARKNVRMACTVINKSGRPLQTYLSMYMSPLFRHAQAEGFEDKWYRSCVVTEDGFLFSVTECMGRDLCLHHYGALVRSCGGQVSSTASPVDYKGGAMRQLYEAECLRTGRFAEEKHYCEFTESAIAGDLCRAALQPKGSLTISYTFSVSDVREQAVRSAHAAENEADAEEKPYRALPQVQMTAEGIDGQLLSYFLHNVFRQAEFCSRAKNYAGDLIGIRDIFQQLECSLFWIPEVCRRRMVEALGFIGEDGRAPRQYSYPRSPGQLPRMDLREFIDQGAWIISTFYTYLAVTGDKTVLDEECGYYRFAGREVSFSDKRDTALEHLLRILDFLLRNLDERTHCVHALYGDWNDALDGLGRTDDPGKEFGTGVSVMATMQVYRNCIQVQNILTHIGKFADKAKEYAAAAGTILQGLMEHAVVDDGNGQKKIVHGWGDKGAFRVGSFCDNDGCSRDSATSNAFWVLSGINEKYDMRRYILQAYARLDSKYGIRTFRPSFSPENDKVGRITQLPEGTAENAAVYIHATLFAVWSLYDLGEAGLAEEQLLKVLPITHEYISTTPFVMPNSYIENVQRGFDGESMNDWFTGSGCVLGKILIFEIFGFKPEPGGFTLCPAKGVRFRSFHVKLCVKGGELIVDYHNENSGERRFLLRDESGDAPERIVAADKLCFLDRDISGKKLFVAVVD